MEGAELPEAVAESHSREFRGFRGSIQPYNPEKNEVSKIKSFKSSPQGNVEIDPKLFS